MGRAKFTEWITDEGLAQITIWRRSGLELREIAKNMQVSPQTLSDWQNKFPEIREALKRGDDIAIQIVENALFRSAVGYKYQEVTHERVFKEVPRKDKDGYEIDGVTDTVEEMKVMKVVDRVQPPNATSIIFFLKNHLPDVYKDRRENVLSGSLSNAPDLSNLTTEDLMKAIQELKSAVGEQDEKHR